MLQHPITLWTLVTLCDGHCVTHPGQECTESFCLSKHWLAESTLDRIYEQYATSDGIGLKEFGRLAHEPWPDLGWKTTHWRRPHESSKFSGGWSWKRHFLQGSCECSLQRHHSTTLHKCQVASLEQTD